MERIGIIVGPEQETYARLLTRNLRDCDFRIHVLHPEKGTWQWPERGSISALADARRNWIILASAVADYDTLLPEVVPLMGERVLVVLSTEDAAVIALQLRIKRAQWIVLEPTEYHFSDGLTATVLCRGTNLPLEQYRAFKNMLAGGLPGVKIEIRDDIAAHRASV